MSRVPSRSPFAPVVGFSAAVRAGDRVYVSGTTALDGSGSVVGGDDPYAQAREVLRRIGAVLVEEYDGRAELVWQQAADGADLLRRLGALPGFGPGKAQIFLALLGKQLGVQPPGWREAAGPYGEDGVALSVADVVSAETLQQVRAAKQAAKRAARAGEA